MIFFERLLEHWRCVQFATRQAIATAELNQEPNQSSSGPNCTRCDILGWGCTLLQTAMKMKMLVGGVIKDICGQPLDVSTSLDNHWVSVGGHLEPWSL
jgi:hypothetical protein